MHDCDIVHRDVKPGNFLVAMDEDGRVLAKITDFGLSKLHASHSKSGIMSSNVGTLAFKAPEFWMQDKDGFIKYNSSIDIFALGLTFQAIVQGLKDSKLIPIADDKQPTADDSAYQAIGYKMVRQHLNKQKLLEVVVIKERDDELLKSLKKLILHMTMFEPKERLAMSMIVAELEQIQVCNCSV